MPTLGGGSRSLSDSDVSPTGGATALEPDAEALDDKALGADALGAETTLGPALTAFCAVSLAWVRARGAEAASDGVAASGALADSSSLSSGNVLSGFQWVSSSRQTNEVPVTFSSSIWPLRKALSTGPTGSPAMPTYETAGPGSIFAASASRRLRRASTWASSSSLGLSMMTVDSSSSGAARG